MRYQAVCNLLDEWHVGFRQHEHQATDSNQNADVHPELRLYTYALQVEVERQQQESVKKAKHIKELKEFKLLLEDHLRQSGQQNIGSSRSRRHHKCNNANK